MQDPHKGGVAPFGHPGIKAFWQLLRAFRSLTRPSSPLCAKASTECPSLSQFMSLRIRRRSIKRRSQRQEPHLHFTCVRCSVSEPLRSTQGDQPTMFKQNSINANSAKTRSFGINLIRGARDQTTCICFIIYYSQCLFQSNDQPIDGEQCSVILLVI